MSVEHSIVNYSMPRKILLIRLSAIGDILFSSVVANALHQQDTDVSIDWLVQKEHEAIPGLIGTVDRVIPVDLQNWRRLLLGFRWLKLIRAITQFRRSLKEGNYDLAIDMQGLFKSGLLTWWSGARERIGLGSKEGSGHFMTRTIARLGDKSLFGSEYLYLLEQLKLDSINQYRAPSIKKVDTEAANSLLKQGRVEGDYMVIVPFSTRPQKDWANNAWIELARKLHDSYGMKLLILGGPGDRERASVISQADFVINLAGKTTLPQAMALIGGSRLVVGVDTGLTHAGTLYRLPTIGLFGSTCPYLKTDSDKTRIIYKALTCSPCKRRPTCNGVYTCMTSIKPDEVLEQINSLSAIKRANENSAS